MRTRMPRGACDCHMHIYDDRFQALPDAIIRRAPVSEYRKVCARLGIERMVVVQPSGYGFDNSCTLDAMSQLGSGARGVAVIAADTPASELERLQSLGICGVRYMMVVPGGLNWESIATMADLVGPLRWHLNLQFDGHQFPEKLNLLKALPVDIVIDHMGSFHGGVAIDDLAFRALLSLMESGRVWIKLSAPYAYRMSRSGPPGYEDVGQLARALVKAYPERCLWASNWPHPTESTPPSTADMLSLLDDWVADETTRDRILVDNPAQLYGFDARIAPSAPVHAHQTIGR